MNFWQGKRVMVTGGKGFIGSAIVEECRRLGATVEVFDRPRVNIRSYQDVNEAFLSGSHAEVVFHLAAQTEVVKSFSDPHLTYGVNVLGTLNVLECCRFYKVKSLVIASSDKAYSADVEELYDECQPLGQRGDMYSHSKKAMDELAQTYARLYGMPIRILRCANTYGPGQRNKTTLITSTLDRLFRGQRPMIHSGMENVKREWLYIDDAVDAYLRLAKDAFNGLPRCPLNAGEIAHNVGSGERLSVSQVVRTILAAMDRPVNDWTSRVDANVVESKAPQIGDQGLNCTKFRSLFPTWTTTSFDEGLRRTIAWHKENMR